MSITLQTLQQRLQTMIGDTGGVYTDKYTDAINDAARELYPALFRPLIDETLITGNILPPFIWTAMGTDTSTLALYTTSSASLTKTTTGGLFRNGLSSAKVKATSTDGYLYLSSDNYSRLLDLMNCKVDYKSWAYPSTVNDAFLTIYTLKADSTAQTLNSTTTCPVSKFSLLELESQSINDDIVKIEFRMRAHTSGQNAYFDPPRAIASSVYDYMLPQYFQDGNVSQVWLQTSGYSGDACDDLHPEYAEEFGWHIINDGSYKYLRLPYAPSSERKIKLVGYCPLENDLSDLTDTMTISAERASLLLSYAAYLLFTMQAGISSSDSRDRYDSEAMKWFARAELLKRKLRMQRPTGQIHWS